MNILFVSAVLPYPLHSGGQIRIFNMLKRLSKRHKITLLSFIRSEQEREYIKHLGFCRSVDTVMRGRVWQARYVMGSVFGAYPLLFSSYDNKEMTRKISEAISRDHIDRIHLEPSYVWPSLPKTSLPVIVSEHNVESRVYESYARRFPFGLLRPLLLWDVGKLRASERMVWRNANVLTAVSHSDASIMEEYLSHDVAVVPNGVDLESFPFRKPGKHSKKTLLFVGNFRWLPNHDAADMLVDRIWPDVRKRYPESKLMIVGHEIPSGLMARIRQRGAEAYENVDSIASVYERADVLVAPHAISGGTKFKLLEAMASGVPVVTTTQGVSGLHVTPGVEYLEAQTPEEFIAKICTILDNPALAQTIAANARKRIESEYDWNTIAVVLEHVWKQSR